MHRKNVSFIDNVLLIVLQMYDSSEYQTILKQSFAEDGTVENFFLRRTYKNNPNPERCLEFKSKRRRTL